MKSRAPSKRERRGAVLPFIVLLIATFVGVAAFAVDISRVYLIHGQLETAAEAGALAATDRILHVDVAHASDSALVFVRRNLTDSGTAPDVSAADVVPGHWTSATGTFAPTTGWTDPNTNAVSVTPSHQARYLFGPIYGVNARRIHANAIAAVGSASRITCTRPVAMPYQKLLEELYPTNTPPVTYDLTAADVTRLSALTRANAIAIKSNDSKDGFASGNFYAVRMGPVRFADGTAGNPITSGANDYYSGLQAASCADIPYRGMVGIGDWLQSEQGNMVGKTGDGLSARCGIPGNPKNFTCPTPVPFLVPIWDVFDKTVANPNAFHVKYLGVFYATGFSQSNGILGYFSAMSVHGEYSDEPGPLMTAVLRR